MGWIFLLAAIGGTAIGDGFRERSRVTIALGIGCAASVMWGILIFPWVISLVLPGSTIPFYNGELLTPAMLGAACGGFLAVVLPRKALTVGWFIAALLTPASITYLYVLEGIESLYWESTWRILYLRSVGVAEISSALLIFLAMRELIHRELKKAKQSVP